MKITRAEKYIIVFTLLFVMFTVGVHVGAGRRGDSFSISTQHRDAEEAEPAAAAAETAEPMPGLGKININTASAQELTELNGIGEVLAGRIVEYRSENGKFETIGDITRVPGIGSGIFAKICDDITVE